MFHRQVCWHYMYQLLRHIVHLILLNLYILCINCFISLHLACEILSYKFIWLCVSVYIVVVIVIIITSSSSSSSWGYLYIVCGMSILNCTAMNNYCSSNGFIMLHRTKSQLYYLQWAKTRLLNFKFCWSYDKILCSYIVKPS
jgi:hypothetical protein